MKRKIVFILSVSIVFLFCLDLVAEAGGKGKGGSVYVHGYTRKDGTYVSPHYRSAPDGNPYNNWSYPGNVNPYTGKVAPGNPDTYLKNYYNRDGSKTYSPNQTSQGLQFFPESPALSQSSPQYRPLPESSKVPMTELQKLFGIEKPPPVKKRSGSLSDVF